jgi:carboxymethylenebutenolidase
MPTSCDRKCTRLPPETAVRALRNHARARVVRWLDASHVQCATNEYRETEANMCDQEHFEKDRQEYERFGLVTRKQFGATLGAGIAMMLPQVANAVTVKESEVEVKTADGSADCYFVHPASGAAPAVLIWPDIFGLRPAFRQMGKRLAESGYSVLVVNPFYRTKKAPTAESGGATPIDQVRPLAQSLSETTNMTDAKAFIAWLDGQELVAKNRNIGTQGYCMGGPMAFRTAVAVPDRVGAVASFHGGGLVTDKPNSPHLLAAKTKARFLIAIASNDDQRAPNDKNVLKETFATANLPAEIEVYSSAHGWCPPDSRVYNEPDAEKAWSRLLALYKKALA